MTGAGAVINRNRIRGWKRADERMGRYPELSTALPTHFVKPTRTAKLLTPAIVFTTVAVLAGASVVGIAIAGLVFGSGGVQTGGVKATQGLLLAAVS